MGYGNVAPAPVRSTDPLVEALDDAVPELFAPSLPQATANNMRAAIWMALIERLLFVFGDAPTAGKIEPPRNGHDKRQVTTLSQPLRGGKLRLIVSARSSPPCAGNTFWLPRRSLRSAESVPGSRVKSPTSCSDRGSVRR